MLMFLTVIFFVSCLGQTNKGLLFFEGFASGIEAEIGNPKQCAADAKLTLNDFENGYALIKDGIWEFSISMVQQGLLDWTNGLDEVVQALRDCGAYKLADDIEKLQADIATGEGILKLLAQEVLNIIENDIAGLFRGAINAFSRGDYYNAGVYTGQITGLLLNVNISASEGKVHSKIAESVRAKYVQDMFYRHRLNQHRRNQDNENMNDKIVDEKEAEIQKELPVRGARVHKETMKVTRAEKLNAYANKLRAARR